MTGRLIIASNRVASPGEPRAGGLAVALGEALAERGGVWFGWSGETLERETRGVRLFAEGNVDFALADLTQAEYDGYYLGYANRALWPVFHYRVDLAHFDEAEFAALDAASKLNTAWPFLESLFRMGRAAADGWLEQHRAAVGVASTLNIEEDFLHRH